MIASTTYDVLIGIFSPVILSIIALAVALARTREKVIRLEEWVRLREEQNGKKP